MSLFRRLFGGKAKKKKKGTKKKTKQIVNVFRERAEKQWKEAQPVYERLTGSSLRQRVAFGNKHASVILERMSDEEWNSKAQDQRSTVREYLKAMREVMPPPKASVEEIAGVMLPAQRSWEDTTKDGPDRPGPLVIHNAYLGGDARRNPIHPHLKAIAN